MRMAPEAVLLVDSERASPLRAIALPGRLLRSGPHLRPKPYSLSLQQLERSPILLWQPGRQMALYGRMQLFRRPLENGGLVTVKALDGSVQALNGTEPGFHRA